MPAPPPSPPHTHTLSPPAIPACFGVQRLKPISTLLESMSPDEKAGYRLDEGVLGPVHFRAIEKMYAEQVRWGACAACQRGVRQACRLQPGAWLGAP